MIKKLISVSIFIMLCSALAGQQHSIYSQYIFNLYAINPAYAGEREALSTALSYRAQWVGFEGSPKTQNFSIHSPLPKKHMALGLFFQNENIGARSTPSIMGTYAYKLKLNHNSHLSFGIQGGVLNFQYHWENLTYRQSLDPVAYGTDDNKWVPNIDFGTMYITPKGYIGISVLGINNAHTIHSIKSHARVATVYNLVAGRMFKISEETFLKPSTSIRSYIDGPMQFDINLGALFKNRYWITGTYRYQYGAVISAHVYANDNFHFGYAYDLPLNKLLSSQSGTHELFIGYDFHVFRKKSTVPNYF